ncbi:MAG TPA: protein kinase [Pyrinomonadaceae bacterium]|nr:protein kinase [Pyrinomonadaceae bacterium]
MPPIIVSNLIMDKTIAHYRVLEPLGAGSSGEVWKAEDLKLKRIVAIKLLRTTDSQAIQRIGSEAQMAATLNHPNVATVYEFGETGSFCYLALEWVEGQTLREKVKRGPLELNAALAITIQVADALKTAHGHGLLHCDIKSSNIMLTAEGAVKVLDFGLAKFVSSNALTPLTVGALVQPALVALQDSNAHDSSNGSKFAGTPGYASPEQIRCEPLDRRTDIFSLGVVLYEMLTGRLPFDGEGRLDALHAALVEEVLPVGSFREDVPLELEGIIRKALAKDRDRRYRIVDDLLADLRSLNERLEPRKAVQGALAVPVRQEGPSASTEDASTARALATSLRAFARKWRRWFLTGGMLAAGIVIWSLALLPQRTEWVLTISFMLIAALSAWAYRVGGKRDPEVHSIPVGAAFRGLMPFHEADRDRFYGRDTDLVALLSMIAHSDFRFGVLLGQSGCGKTSLLRAGVLPKLWQEGYLPVYCRSYNDPQAAALEECRRGSQIAIAEGESAFEYLRRVAREFGAIVIIVCDQFEEFFVSHQSTEARQPFLSFIEACHNDEKLPVKFLVSMRSDFLYLISSELGQRIAEPLISSRLYHLRKFDEAQAREIIDKSARRAGLPFAEGLSRQVASDLASGGVVAPSELQIVGEQLQNKRIYTVESYRRAGGKEPLVHSFLEDVIQSSGDAAGARLLLRSLISEENTRLTLTLDEIAKRTQRNTASVERLLHLFVRARLINELQDDDPWRYELMHEYLIERINQITGKVMDATQRANRLFRQYLSNYQIDGRTRIPAGRLWFIRRYSDVAIGERERSLIRKSLRWGLVKIGALTLVLSFTAMLVAVALSLDEEWEGVRLNDGHTAAARKARFSPDGRLLVSVGEDGKIIVWDFIRRERIANLGDNRGWVNSVAFAPDGKSFATGGADQKVTVWDAARLEKKVVLPGHNAAVSVLAFSPDGGLLASTSGPYGRTIIWNTTRWEKVHEVDWELTWGDLNFSPDGRRLLVGSQLLDLSTESMVGEMNITRPAFNSLSPDGSRMIGVASYGAVFFSETTDLWQGAESRFSSQPAHSYHGRAATFSPDGRLAASAAEDIVLWDALTDTKIVRLKHSAQVWSLAFSPDGRWLVSTHDDGSVLLWDVAEREQAASFNGHIASVHAVAFSPDGKRIASVGEDRAIIIWNAERQEKEMVLMAHSTRVTSLAFSPDGKRLASSDMHSNTILWDLESRKVVKAHMYVGARNSTMAVYCVAFSPDGRFLATTNAVYDASNLDVVYDLYAVGRPAFADRVGAGYGMAFSPDSKLLAAATDSGALAVWHTENWRPASVVKPGGTPLISLSFRSDGKTLVTGDDDGIVRLWEVNPLRQIATLGRHGARIKSLAFSPDGAEVVSAGDDQMVYLWNVERRSLITRIGTHTSPVLTVAFSPDGKRVVSGEHDKTVRLFTRHRTLWGRRLD